MGGLNALLGKEASSPDLKAAADDGAAEGAEDEGYADAGDALKEALSSGDGMSVAKAVEKLVELCQSKM
jgi:hypothetical protein